MQTNNAPTRQLMGCGFLPPPPERLRPYVDAPAPLGFRPSRGPKGERLDNVCPGYTSQLPEVIEVARARLHWDKGHLVEFLGGPPTEPMLLGIEILCGAVGELQMWLSTPKDQGGGAG
jgi:hypothetical protein